MNHCLYCGTKSGKFMSMEHIVPESLGNSELILPKGVVCDSCNNGVLAYLDNILLKDEVIGFFRTWFKIPNKTGKLADAKYGNMRVSHKDKGIRIDLAKFSPKHLQEVNTRPDGHVEFKLNMIGRKLTENRLKEFARSLYKIGLGIVYLDDSKLALSPRFDEVRQIILGNKDFCGYIVINIASKPTVHSNMIYRHLNLPNGRRVALFQLRFFGVEYIFDFENRVLLDKESIKRRGFPLLEWSAKQQ